MSDNKSVNVEVGLSTFHEWRYRYGILRSDKVNQQTGSTNHLRFADIGRIEQETPQNARYRGIYR
jgi:hypothetical protein